MKINFLNSFRKNNNTTSLIKDKAKSNKNNKNHKRQRYKEDDIYLLDDELYRDYPPIGVILLNKNIPINKVEETILKIVNASVEFDFKKVGETVSNSIYLLIRGPHKYSGIKRIVVPTSYVVIRKVAQKYKSDNNWVLVVKPINNQTLFAIVKDGEIIYSQLRDISMASDTYDKIAQTILSVINDARTYYITADINLVSFIQPQREFDSDFIHKLNKLNIKFIIEDVKVNKGDYDDVLTINQQYAYKIKITKPLNNILSREVSKIFKKNISFEQIIASVLIFFTAFAWIYFPLNNALRYMIDQYQTTNQQILADINNINVSKKVFADAVKTFKDKIEIVHVYDKTIQPPPLKKYKQMFSLIEDTQGGTIKSIQFNKEELTIIVEFTNTSLLDNYTKKLLMSGMFESLKPTPRMNKPYQYMITLVLNKKYFQSDKSVNTNSNSVAKEGEG